MNVISRKLSLLLVLSFLFINLFSQGSLDLQNTKVDDLSDAQIQSLLTKAKSMGYGESDIYVLAQSQGVSASELVKLKARIEEINRSEDKKEDNQNKNKALVNKSQPKRTSKKIVGSIPFGYDLFNPDTQNLSFETNLNIPTPQDYVIGPRDEIIINIYGASEKNYQEPVNVRGYLLLPNIGPVFLSGLTVAQAAEKVRGRLSAVYTDLGSSDPKTFMQLSIAAVRNLKVNIVGEVKMPGTYTVNGLATVFNAIYLSGGPTTNGTLREIKVYRKNKLITSIDYYDFLVKGITETNIRLQSDDIIMVGPTINRVTISGQVKRPGIFEMREGETFKDLLAYAGGFTEEAYREKIRVYRNNDKERLVSDIFIGQHNIFEVKAGDSYDVDKILDRYANRVVIKGAVYRPGNYALTDNMTVRDLIKRADGLMGDAFMDRAIIVRSKSDFSTETINISLKDLMTYGKGDEVLKREDVLQILSIYDVKEETYVKISGEVNKGGVFPYSENLTVQDLIFMAGGFTLAAEPSSIEISRQPKIQSADSMAQVMLVSLDEGLKVMDNNGGEVVLSPYDHVFVRRNPNYYPESTVELVGQMQFPGKYTLLSKGDRISDLIKRAGGLRPDAYIKGATLLRKTEFFHSENTLEARKEDLGGILETLDSTFVSEADEKLVSEIYEELNNNYLFPDNDEVNLATSAKRERLNEIARINPYLQGLDIKRSESIAVNLEKILKYSGSKEDLILEDGDIISIPKELKTIRMRGKVLYPNTVRYESGKSLKHYIDKAGGFDGRAQKSRTYVVYANGEVSRTKQFLWFRTYPKPEPGSEVIVPVKPLKIPLKPGEIVGLTSGLATLAVLVTQLIQLNRN